MTQNGEYQFLILLRIPIILVEADLLVSVWCPKGSVTQGPWKVGARPRGLSGSLQVTGRSGKSPCQSWLGGCVEQGRQGAGVPPAEGQAPPQAGDSYRGLSSGGWRSEKTPGSFT